MRLIFFKISLLIGCLSLNGLVHAQTKVDVERVISHSFSISAASLSAENTYYENYSYGFDKTGGLSYGLSYSLLLPIKKHFTFEAGGGLTAYNISGYYHCHVCGIATPIVLGDVRSLAGEAKILLRYEFIKPLWGLYVGVGFVGSEMVYFGNDADLFFNNESPLNIAGRLALGFNRSLTDKIDFSGSIYYDKTIFRQFLIPVDRIGMELGLNIKLNK